MSLFFETICLENGKAQNLDLHNERMNKTRKDFFGASPIDLRQHIFTPNMSSQKIKCRVLYSQQIHSITYEKYTPKKIQSFALIEVANDFTYTYKHNNRIIINQHYAHKGKCDDVLFVRNHLVTDSSFCNVAFYVNNEWCTPAVPLLKGTMREKLLREKRLVERDLGVRDIEGKRMAIMNAMVGFVEIENFYLAGLN